jgi:hypothetical protein
MARIELNVESSASPEQVIDGLTDFSDRRPDLWPGLNPKMYRVYEVGDTWADVREGNSDAIWARERYDWSTPGMVRRFREWISDPGAGRLAPFWRLRL